MAGPRAVYVQEHEPGPLPHAAHTVSLGVNQQPDWTSRNREALAASGGESA